MLVLVVEIMGASTVVLYGINLLFTPDPPTYEPDPARPGLPKVWLLGTQLHMRVPDEKKLRRCQQLCVREKRKVLH